MLIANYFFVKSCGVFVMDIPKKFRKIVIIRSIAGFAGIAGIFNGVKYLPVATANCIIMTNPLWTSLMSFAFLKESISKVDVVSIFLAFLGVVLINDPFGWNKDQE